MSVPDVRVEVAFTTAPDSATPNWEDVTAYTDLSAGISITRGRQDEFSQVQASTCSLVLDNSDGRFTAGLSSSPYYPDVKIGRKLRVFVGGGNLLAAESASFEGGTVGGWAGDTFGIHGAGTVVANSTTRAQDGTKSMKITWPTASQAAASIPVSGLEEGSTYTASAYVWVSAGSPAVRLSVGSSALPLPTTLATSTVTGAWQRLSGQFGYTNAYQMYLFVETDTAPTSGQTVWVDGVMIEYGSTLGTFTTSSPPPARFTGYVDEWPVEWAPVAAYSRATVTATDRLKRLGAVGALTNVIGEEILYDTPAAYYPLGEADGSTTAGDSSGRGMSILSTAQLGTGGTLEFGAGTGPGTDGLTAPIFTPSSSTNGKYLSGAGVSPVGSWDGLSIRACVLTSAAVAQVAVQAWGNVQQVQIGTTAAGKVTASGTAAAFGGGSTSLFSITSASSFNDGATHDVVLSIVLGGTATLYVDGASVGTDTFAASALSDFSALRVGSDGSGSLFSGTLAHVAVYSTTLSAARVTEQYHAVHDGFTADSSDERVARYARWAGVSTADLNLEAGDTTSIAHVDTTGAAPLQAMQDVAATESGVLFIAGDGRLTFHARSHRYNATSAMTLDEIGVDDRFVVNDQQLVNDVTASRTGGITYRAVASDSITDYGTYRTDLSLLTTSDNEVVDAANWNANVRSMPTPRLPQLTIDLLTNSAIQSTALALEIGSLVALSSLPAQAPDSASSLFIEGWTETISAQAWSLACNTSPAGQSSVWALDDAVFSVLDQTTTLAY